MYLNTRVHIVPRHQSLWLIELFSIFILLLSTAPSLYENYIRILPVFILTNLCKTVMPKLKFSVSFCFRCH